MYKFKSYLMALLAAGSVAFMTSCGDEGTEPDPKPTLDFVAGTGNTSADATVTGGSSFTTKVNGKSNANGNNLDRFKITVSYDNAAPVAVVDSAIGKETFEYTFNGSTRTVVGTEKWTFTLTDRKNNSVSKSFTLTTNNPNSGAQINTFSAKMMGGQNNGSFGSFFNADNGTVMLAAQAKASQGNVDFIYYYGANDKATLAAPNDANVQVFTSTLGVNTWTTKNATTFRTGISNTAFMNATTETDIMDAYNAGNTPSTASRVVNLAVGDIVAFMTADNKHGLAKVTALTPSNSGTITLEVKVQK